MATVTTRLASFENDGCVLSLVSDSVTHAVSSVQATNTLSSAVTLTVTKPGPVSVTHTFPANTTQTFTVPGNFPWTRAEAFNLTLAW